MRYLAAILILIGCDPAEPMLDAGVDAEAPWGDSDGDGISDVDEGRAEDRNTDRDRLPDYRDLDSDDNGIPDAVEGRGDFDGDGLEDYADLDDDDDYVQDRMEIAGLPDAPPDTDGDGQPNFRDPDSDDDLILDGHEFGVDTDMDGLFDQEDLDTDGDGFTDTEEAGDDDLFSEPVDTDEDGIPDFRDVDSDGDGLSDAEERALGTDARSSDSDGDGVSDRIEVAAGTDPTDDASSPERGSPADHVVTVRRCAPPWPQPLEVRVELMSPSAPVVDVSLRFDAGDAETEELFGSAVAAPDLPGCADRPWTGATYLGAEEGDTLCFEVTSQMNRTIDESCRDPRVFLGELVLRESTGAEPWRGALYYIVPTCSYAPSGPDDGC